MDEQQQQHQVCDVDLKNRHGPVVEAASSLADPAARHVQAAGLEEPVGGDLVEPRHLLLRLAGVLAGADPLLQDVHGQGVVGQSTEVAGEKGVPRTESGKSRCVN